MRRQHHIPGRQRRRLQALQRAAEAPSPADETAARLIEIAAQQHAINAENQRRQSTALESIAASLAELTERGPW